MTITRRALEPVWKDLKRRSFDVFPDVDLATFDPLDEGKEPNFVMWAKGAFDTRGKLARPLTGRWGGNRNDVQIAFARAGMVTRIEDGTFVLPPDADQLSNDLLRLLGAFDVLDKNGIIALANAGDTQSAGWEDVAERDGGKKRSAVFWHDQCHDRFDAHGNLSAELPLYWRGDAKKIAAPIRKAGFDVDVPTSEDSAISVRSKKSIAPEVAAPVVASAPIKTTDRKPITRLAFAPNGRLVVARTGDSRGPAERRLALHEASGDVARVFGSESAFSSCGGCDFLGDGRMVFSWCEVGEKSSMRLCVWDPSTDREKNIVQTLHTHPTWESLSTIDRAGARVGMITSKGAAIFETAKWKRIADVAGPFRSYQLAAISPDGKLLAWASRSTEKLQCFEIDRGKLRWEKAYRKPHVIVAGGPRGIMFDPSSEHIFLLHQNKGFARSLASYSVRDGALKATPLAKKGRDARAIAFAPDGKSVAIATAKAVSLLAYPTAKPLALAKPKPALKGQLTALAFDGARIAVGTDKGEIAILDV